MSDHESLQRKGHVERVMTDDSQSPEEPGVADEAPPHSETRLPQPKASRFSFGSLPGQLSMRSLRASMEESAEPSTSTNNARNPKSTKKEHTRPSLLGRKQTSKRSMPFTSNEQSQRSMKQNKARQPSTKTSLTTITQSNNDDSLSSGVVHHRSAQSLSQASLGLERMESLDDADTGNSSCRDTDALSSLPAEKRFFLPEAETRKDFEASFRAVDGSASMYFAEASTPFMEQMDLAREMYGRTQNDRNREPKKPRNGCRKRWDSTWNAVQQFRDICGALVNDERVQFGLITLIIINAIMMGIATFAFVKDSPHIDRAFQVADEVFLSVFTIEIGMQLIYHGLHLFLDAWLFFDFFIIILSWSLDGFQIIRAFRVFRALRLITRLDVLRNLLTALFAVAPSLGGIVALLVLIMYIYAVMFTVLFKNLYQEGVTDLDYFGSLFASLFTCFQLVTLDNWAYIARQVGEASKWSWALFSSYLLITSFILYSLIIAVVCDAVKVTEHQEEKDEQLREEGEIHVRVVLLEQHIASMAEQQFSIVENLHAVMRGLDTFHSEESDYSEVSADEDDDCASEVDEMTKVNCISGDGVSVEEKVVAWEHKVRSTKGVQGDANLDQTKESLSLIREADSILETVKERSSISDASGVDLHLHEDLDDAQGERHGADEEIE